MILNISNNTDLVQFYTEWLMNRFYDGFFSIETEKQNNIYELNPNNFELLVFQTKNPTNLISHIPFFINKGFNFLFIVTLNPYNSDIEPNVNKKEAFLSFKKISKEYGKKKIVWKYAPIILNGEFNKEYHIKKFECMCKKMNQYTDSCICDFIESYELPVHASLYAPTINQEDKEEILKEFEIISSRYGIRLYSKHTKNNISVLMKQKILAFCGIKIENKLSVLDMGLKNTCKGNCEYCFCGGNKYFKNTNCINQSPVMIGQVDKTKKHIKRKGQKLS